MSVGEDEITFRIPLIAVESFPLRREGSDEFREWAFPSTGALARLRTTDEESYAGARKLRGYIESNQAPRSSGCPDITRLRRG